ncbi:MAG TPA: FAD-dependent oxidoreductase, partial [Pyrinomonadaceae bacterium]
VMLRFREPFWNELVFVHAPSESLPTWWTQFPDDSPLLAGWAGGPRAEKLALESEDSLLDHALQSLAHVFQTSRNSLEQQLEAFYTHNWQSDPFSAGAYSYIPVGGNDAQAQLAEAVEGTLLFAGEATNTEGHHGTVHGAIASGLRAASEIMEAHGTERDSAW